MRLLQEALWTLRRLARRPMSAAGIILTLALGIGISVGMFSVLYGVVLQALPYPDGNDIVIVHSANPETGVARGQLTPAEAIEGLASVSGFAHAAYYHWGAYTYTADGAARNITSLHVSADYFRVFGVNAVLGRTLNDSDVAERREVIVLSHAAWMNLTGGDPQAIGNSITFKDAQFELVGVMPEEFAHPGSGQVIYRPIDTAALSQNVMAYPHARYINGIGRLAAGVPGELALDGLARHLAAVNETHGLPDRGWRLVHTRLVDDTIGQVRKIVFALFAVSLFVLLISCANTASLVSLRLQHRHAELAVRRALGASTSRVLADVGLELGALGAMAAVTGMMLAHALIGGLQPLAIGSLPRAANIGLDGTALIFAMLVTVLSVLLSGALPIWRALRAGPAANLGAGAARDIKGGAQIAWLPVAGVGLSTLALVMALTLVTSLVRLGSVDPGYRVERITGLQLFRPNNDEVPQFVAQATEALEAVPGVRKVAAVSAAPLSLVGSLNVDVAVRGRELTEPLQAIARRATPGYHQFIGTPLLHGRDISETDAAGAPGVVVINETLARRVFGTANPLGATLLLPLGSGERVPVEVVGIVADVRNAGLRAPPEPELVVPLAQLPWAGVTLLVDAAIEPANWVRTLQEVIWAIDGEQAIFRSFTFESEIESQLREAKFFATATGWFAVFALLLGAAGVNAVIAAMQRKRRREIGLRMALGAAPGHAARLVLGSAAKIVALGLFIGGALAYPGFGWLQRQLFGLGPEAFWSLLGLTAAVLLAAGLAAACWPAWRAARVAPMEVLRHE